MNNRQTEDTMTDRDERTLLQELEQQIVKGRLSRRDVLRRAMALGMSAPVISGLLAACGEDEGDDIGVDAEPTDTLGPVTGTPAGGGPTPPTDTFDDVTVTPVDLDGSPTATDGGATPAGHGRGVADLLRILYWQAPTILNPHFSQGTKDSAAASLVLEPLLDVDKDGNLVPVLAAEVPSLENGGVAEDGMRVTYKLKPDVVWSDGQPVYR
jgi:peptide/nickel transport system substrate-binding protein